MTSATILPNFFLESPYVSRGCHRDGRNKWTGSPRAPWPVLPIDDPTANPEIAPLRPAIFMSAKRPWILTTPHRTSATCCGIVGPPHACSCTTEIYETAGSRHACLPKGHVLL